jgi:OmpR-family two-component system manganese-sensing response regulator
MIDSSRILFDDEDSCQMMSQLLGLADHSLTVIPVSTAGDAISLIETEKFDLYILDYRLSDTTGIELCGRIRRLDPLTPIMFYSGMAGESNRRAARDAAADEYLVKPDDLDRLTQKVKQLLSSARH